MPNIKYRVEIHFHGAKNDRPALLIMDRKTGDVVKTIPISKTAAQALVDYTSMGYQG